LALVLASVQAAPSLPPGPLDLAAALRFALDHNLSILQARERIRQQDGVVLEIAARRVPTVAASALYQRNDPAVAQGFPPSGQAWQMSLTATQVVYSAGAVPAAVSAAKLTREAATLELQAVINAALLQVRTAFLEVLLAREQIRVQESNLELLREQLRTVSDRYQAGTVSSFEKLRAEVAVANAQVPLITARNALRLSGENLRLALGLVSAPGAARPELEVVGTLTFAPQAFDRAAALDAARAQRPDLQRLAKLASAREEGVTTARAGLYPNLAAFGGWTLRKGPTSQFGDSNHGWLLGVQSQWDIFDGRATRGREAQARSALNQTRLVLAEAELAVDVEVSRAHSGWQQASELADASARVVEQAAEAVRLANARYEAGSGTQLDVLSAQVELTTARTNQIQAFYQYNVAVAALRKAMGQGDELMARP
jgi:outer membrane protein TolC